jgi:hypothetical protein
MATSSGTATIDPKSQGDEVVKLYSFRVRETDWRKAFLEQLPLTEYTFDAAQPDRLQSEICREQGRQREYYSAVTVLTCSCLQLKISSKQLFDQMQKRMDSAERVDSSGLLLCTGPESWNNRLTVSESDSVTHRPKGINSTPVIRSYFAPLPLPYFPTETGPSSVP